MTVPLLFGVVAGLGLCCVAVGLFRPDDSLGEALARLGRPAPTSAATSPTAEVDVLAHRLGRVIMALLRTDLRPLATDLSVLERSDEVHLVQRIRTAAFYASIPLMAWGLTWSFSVSVFAPWQVAAAMAVGAAAGWLITDAQVRSRARHRRRQFDTALVTYLSLVSVLLSGGAGVQEALTAAVEQGRGWSFVVLRRALTDARLRGVSPWETLTEHGARLGLTTLVDLAATMELAGTSGAHVRDTLLTKAGALRARESAAVEREATGRTTAMVGPTGLMMTGFVILIIYPAFQAVLDL